MGLLRTFLIIALVYFGLKILARFFIPLLTKTIVNKAKKNFTESYTNHQNKTNKGKEGETVIDKMPSQQKPTRKKVGEYVDFEEIE